MEPVEIGGRPVGPGAPTYVIAELSANHGGRLERALELVREAAEAGADAIKIQTYTPDGMTLDVDRPAFVIGAGTQWEGRRLHDPVRRGTDALGVARPIRGGPEGGHPPLSSPFDHAAVEFLADFDVPAYKIASFELVDLPLIADVASRGKPVIMSTGMASVVDVEAAVAAAAPAPGLVLLRCNSAYPAAPEEMDLTIPDMIDR